MKILNIYFSATGNTAKAGKTIEEKAAAGHEVTSLPVKGVAEVRFLDYDVIFMGSGVYHWLPGKPLIKLIEQACATYRKSGDMPCNSSPRPNIKAVIYCRG